MENIQVSPLFAFPDNVGKPVLNSGGLNGAQIKPDDSIFLTGGGFLKMMKDCSTDHIAGGQFAIGMVVKGKTTPLGIDQVGPFASDGFTNQKPGAPGRVKAVG
jgi:hypothetical protein